LSSLLDESLILERFLSPELMIEVSDMHFEAPRLPECQEEIKHHHRIDSPADRKQNTVAGIHQAG
jgi:hypothetical protein